MGWEPRCDLYVYPIAQSVRDQALNELIDMLAGKLLWFQPPEEDHNSAEDAQSGQ